MRFHLCKTGEGDRKVFQFFIFFSHHPTLCYLTRIVSFLLFFFLQVKSVLPVMEIVK